MDRAIFPARRRIFRARLTFQNCTIGNGIGVRSPDLSFEEPRKSTRALQNAFLLIVHIQNVERLRGFCQALTPCAQEPAKYWSGKRIEEKGHAGPRGQRELDGIAAKHSHGGDGAACSTPLGHIPAADARQRRMGFDTDYGAKGIHGSKQHGAAHAGTKIHKRIFVEVGEWLAAPPTNEDALKDRRSDCIVGRYVAIVTATGAKMAAGNQTAGANSEFKVEGMPDKAIFDSEPLQKSRPRPFILVAARYANAHA